MKVVINRCYGGFGLSAPAFKYLMKLKKTPCYFFEWNSQTKKFKPVSVDSADSVGLCWHAFSIKNPVSGASDEYAISYRDFDRHDSALVATVEKFGRLANGQFAELAVVEVPDGVDYEIEEYDGIEWVSEKHRTWQ
jgi:hypothetical protein